MKLLVILLALLIGNLSSSSSAVPADQDSSGDLEKIISDAIVKFQPVTDSGISISVIKGGKIYYSGGFGYRNRQTKDKVTPETFFAIGSATKAFTSAAISMLAEDGVVSLDQPIKHYLPNFRMKDDEATQQMTLKDILSHRTGLPRHDALWYLGSFDRSGLFHRIQYLDPNPAPGAGFRKNFEYNNLMYTVAGYLLEKITDQTWESFVKARIFDRMNMTESHFSIDEYAEKANFALGYKDEDELPLKDVENIGPAGAINSNCIEMANWILFHLNHGVTPSGRRLLSQVSLEKMYSPYIAVPEMGPGISYGLGWFVGDMDGKQLIFHQGHTDGFSAYVSFMPDDGLGVVVLSNQHHSKFPDLVAQSVYSYLLNLPVSQSVEGAKEVLPTKTLGRASSGNAKSSGYAGTYFNSGYGDLSVKAMGANLFLSYYKNTWPLHQISENTFYFDLSAYGSAFKVPVLFRKSAAGVIQSVEIPFEPKVPKIKFDRR